MAVYVVETLENVCVHKKFLSGLDKMPDYHPRPANGECQSCKKTPDKLYIDYDKEYRFRGYLCRRCKLIMAYADEDPGRLMRLYDYMMNSTILNLNATTRRAAG